LAEGIFKFGDFTLDCDRFELLHRGHSLRLERKPMELLILLAARNGHLVTRAEIAKQLWEQQVFVDTEHGINTAVRKIRQTLKDDSEKPRFVQTVTGKGYRFIGVLEEMALQTAVEEKAVTPELLKGVTPSLSTSPEFPQLVVGQPISRRRLWWGVLALGCAVLLVLFGAHQLRARQMPVESLAVLPLENLTGDPGQEYIANGLTDELTTMLAKNSNLRVTSRTSTLQYKGVHRPLREIARELGVSGIVEGSLSRNGARTHLNLQLIAVPSDTHLWADSYDRDAQGLLLLPRDAAEAITRRLGRVVPDPPVAKYVNPAAHDAYLRVRYLWFTDHTHEAGPYFERATALQPDYAAAWSGLANYYGASAVKGELSPSAWFAGMKAASARALQLDASLPEAHLAAAGTAMAVDWDLKGAEAEAKKAIALDPQFAEAHHLLAKILAAQSRQAEAIAAQRRATEIDPFTRPWAMALAYIGSKAIGCGVAGCEGEPGGLSEQRHPCLAYTCHL